MYTTGHRDRWRSVGKVSFVYYPGSGSHLVIRTHQQGIFKTFISSRSNFSRPLRSSAIPESPNVSQIL